MSEALLRLCRELQLTSEDLDELVYEAAGEQAARLANQSAEDKAERIIEDEEARAARINNEGLSAQIQLLLECYGPIETISR